MKSLKYSLIIVLVLLVHFTICSNALAVLINNGKLTLQQPNGYIFTVEHRIDEFFNYFENDYGYVMKNNADSYYYYANYISDGSIQLTDIRVGDEFDNLYRIKELASTNYKTIKQFASTQRNDNLLSLPTNYKLAKTMLTTSLPDSLNIILVEFDDVKHRSTDAYTVAEWTSAYFENDTYTYPDDENSYKSFQ